VADVIEIPTTNGPVEALLARPDDDPHPGVLFFMNAAGLRPALQQMADRIASSGYVVLVPNVLYRHGRAAEVTPRVDMSTEDGRKALFDKAGPAMRALTPGLFADDLPAYLDALRDNGAAPGPVGVTGYCFGAQLAIRAACLDQNVKAAAGFHGGNLATEEPDSPHLGLPNARAEFVFGHADDDPSMPPEQVTRLGEALTAAGLRHTNEVYDGTRHGYTMPDSPIYDENASERHFKLLQDLFARTLH